MGLAYYRHPDWLGSSRFASTPARAMYFDGAYAPFGDPYVQTTDLSFTGMNQDTVSALYDFPAREYGIQGRWPSPDPAGLAAVDPANPQSWNRYAYADNDPTTNIDPTGLVTIQDGRVDMGSVIGAAMSIGFGSGAGPICNVDGASIPCSMVAQMLHSGAAALCPENDCSKLQVGQQGQWQILLWQADQNPPCHTGVFCVGSVGQLWANVSFLYLGGPDTGGGSGGPSPQAPTPRKPSFSQRAKTYLTQYVPCAMEDFWIGHFVGDKEHTEAFLWANVFVPAGAAAKWGPWGVLVGVTGAAAYDFKAAIQTNQTCTAQVYGSQQ